MAAAMSEREQIRDELFCDHFESHWCVGCGGHGALYAIAPGEFLGACSRCLLQRIQHLRDKGGEVPPWVAVLEREAKHELEYEAEKESTEFALSFDDFYHCCRCDKLIHQRDARYPTQAKDRFGAISPHCLECYALVAGQ